MALLDVLKGMGSPIASAALSGGFAALAEFYKNPLNLDKYDQIDNVFVQGCQAGVVNYFKVNPFKLFG